MENCTRVSMVLSVLLTTAVRIKLANFAQMLLDTKFATRGKNNAKINLKTKRIYSTDIPESQTSNHFALQQLFSSYMRYWDKWNE